MSGYVAGKVWNSNLSGTLKPLTACLADLGNNDGAGIYPSVEYLVWLLGVSERTIRSGMVSLREMGILVAVANERGGRGKVPLYKLDISKFPERESWRSIKGAENVPLSVKGAENDIQRVQKTTVKGAENDMRNKEEPLVEPLVLTPPAPPLSGNGNGKYTDPRYKAFIEAISSGYKKRGWDFAWDNRDGDQLKKLLKKWPQWTVERFRIYVQNYFASDGVGAGGEPFRYLPNLARYTSGPLDRFGKLRAEV